MEERKVVVRIKRGKELGRFERRAKERKEEKKPSKQEILESAGLSFFTFVLNKDATKVWCEKCEEQGIKPNERMAQLISEDMK